MTLTERVVQERDLRMPEFKDVDPSELEFRADGKIVRKDRWEKGIRDIVGILGMSRDEFEIGNVVLQVRINIERIKFLELLVRRPNDSLRNT